MKRHQPKQVAFKKCAPFTKCITKIDGTTTDDAVGLHLVIMSMHNLIEYSWNYSETVGRLWFYSKDEATNFNVDIAYTSNLKSFKCKTNLLAKIEANGDNGILKTATIAVALKC